MTLTSKTLEVIEGYDNGANMAGIDRGAQAFILGKNPQAMFSPCSAHSLNLRGIHAVESSPEVKSSFGRNCTTSSVPVLHNGKFCRKLHTIRHQIPIGVQELM